MHTVAKKCRPLLQTRLGRCVAAFALALPAWVSAQPAAATSADANRALAVRFLESIQRQTYLSLGREPPVYGKEFMDRFIERYLNSPGAASETPEGRDRLVARIRQIAESGQRSRYEDPFGYSIVESLDRQIKDVLDAGAIKLDSIPVFGTLPTLRVNARTFAVPGSDLVVIAFEDQMFEFALLFTKAAAYTLPGKRGADGGAQFSTAKDDIRKRIETDPEPLKRFQEVLMAYIFGGRPGLAPQYFQGEPHASAANALRESMELFILGHEYGHFIAHHLREGRQIKAAIGSEEVTEIVRSWADEFEADAYGLQLSVAAMRRAKVDLALSYWGCDFFFTTLDIIDRALRLVATGEETDPDLADATRRSHPPAPWRRDQLRKAVKAFEGGAASEPLALAESLQFAMELMWEKTRPLFVQAHEAGRRAHPSWQQ